MANRYLKLIVAVVSGLAYVDCNAQVVDHFYLDPQYIDNISKFRSCAGHHYGYEQMIIDLGLYELETDPGETNRSMKHYFEPLGSYRDSERNDLLELYAPFDGTIYRVSDEGHDSGYVNKQVWVRSNESPDIYAIIFHVNLLDTFPQYWNDYPAELWQYHGDDDTGFERLTVTSGEMVGYADLRGTISDIAILQRVSDTEYHYLSYFDETIMTDEVFSIYRQYGIPDREGLIFSRAFRDANPLAEDCWDSYHESDWVSFNTQAPVSTGDVLLLILQLQGD